MQLQLELKELAPAPPPTAVSAPPTAVSAPPTAAPPAPSRGRAQRDELGDLAEAFVRSACDSPHTRRNYLAHLLKAFVTMRSRRLDELTVARLAGLRAAITSRADLAPASKAFAISAVRSFLRWCWEVLGDLHFPLEHALGVLKMPEVHTVNAPEVLVEREIDELLGQCRATVGERAMVMVLLGAGLRSAELTALDCMDIRQDLGGTAVLKVRGKRGRERLVPIRPPVLDAIREYLTSTGRQLGHPGPVFMAHDCAAGQRGQSARLSTRSVRRRVRKLLKRAGVTKNVRTHGMRHTYAVLVMKNGGKIHVLRRLLGHASIQTTQRYIDHLDFAELATVVPVLGEGLEKIPSSDGAT